MTTTPATTTPASTAPAETAAADPATGRARPAGARAAAREQAILDAALELLAEVGYDRLSMDALAERAKAGKATIYRHWSGKAEVVAAAVRCHQPVDLAAAFDTGSLHGDLVAMVTRMSEMMAAEDGALIAGVLRAAQGDPALAELLRVQVIEGKQDGFRRLVLRAVRRGELDSAAAADTVFEVARAMVVSRVVVNGEAVTPAFIHHVADAVLLPLLAGGATPSVDRSEERP